MGRPNIKVIDVCSSRLIASYQLLMGRPNIKVIGRSENKDMKQCSSFENEVRPGVLMIVLRFSYLISSSSFLSRYGGEMWPPCSIRTKILISANKNSCRVCTTPGLTSFRAVKIASYFYFQNALLMHVAVGL